MHYGYGWGWGWGALWMVLFWGGLILAVVWAVKHLGGQQHSGHEVGKSALDIAKERYARGEISKDQFEQIKKDVS